MADTARASAVSERRGDRRFDVLGQLQAHTLPKLRPVALREMTTGGFSLEMTAPAQVGSIHRFRLGLDGGPSVEVAGNCRHCTLQSTARSLPIYIVGFQFVDVGPAELDQLREMVGYAESFWAE